MNDTSIPVLAYALIGITTLVLSYVTLIDTGSDKPSSIAGASATSLLPSSLQSSSSPSPQVAVPMSPTPQGTELPIAKSYGGKKTKRRNPGHKKTKRSHR